MSEASQKTLEQYRAWKMAPEERRDAFLESLSEDDLGSLNRYNKSEESRIGTQFKSATGESFKKPRAPLYQNPYRVRDMENALQRMPSYQARDEYLSSKSEAELRALKEYRKEHENDAVQEMHPDISEVHRQMYMNTLTDPSDRADAVMRDYPHLKAVPDLEGQVRIEDPIKGTRGVLDKDFFKSKLDPVEMLRDVGDASTDVATLFATGLGGSVGRAGGQALAKTLPSWLRGVAAERIGAGTGLIAGSAAAGAGMEGAKQAAAKELLDILPEYRPTQIADAAMMEGAAGFAFPPAKSSMEGILQPFLKKFSSNVEDVARLSTPAGGVPGQAGYHLGGGAPPEIRDLIRENYKNPVSITGVRPDPAARGVKPDLKGMEETTALYKENMKKAGVRGEPVFAADADAAKKLRREVGEEMKAEKDYLFSQVDNRIREFSGGIDMKKPIPSKTGESPSEGLYTYLDKRMEQLDNIAEINGRNAKQDAEYEALQDVYNKVFKKRVIERDGGRVVRDFFEDVNPSEMSAADLDAAKQAVQDIRYKIKDKSKLVSSEREWNRVLSKAEGKIISTLDNAVEISGMQNDYGKLLKLESQLDRHGIFEKGKNVTKEKSYREVLAESDGEIGASHAMEYNTVTKKDKETLNSIYKKDKLATDSIYPELQAIDALRGTNYAQHADTIRASRYFLPKKDLTKAEDVKRGFASYLVGPAASMTLGAASRFDEKDPMAMVKGAGIGLGAYGLLKGLQTRPMTRILTKGSQALKGLPKVGGVVDPLLKTRPFQKSIYKEYIHPELEDFEPKLRSLVSGYEDQ